MYTTPVQSAQYKLNSVLSLAGMKVGDAANTLSSYFNPLYPNIMFFLLHIHVRCSLFAFK